MSLMLNSNSDEETLYSDSVFSTYLYTGNGSTQTITNGIDLAGKGGMVWIKSRSMASANILSNTVQGLGKYCISNNTDAVNDHSLAYSANSNGWSVSGNQFDWNNNGNTYASWTFRKAAKFFDVVTYTGDGVAGRSIAHSLGVAPGMIIVKSTSYALGWPVYHRSNGAGAEQYLNTTDAVSYGGKFPSAPTSSSFYISENDYVNKLGETYVAYLFAHDTSSTGIIQCGSYTGTGAAGNTITLGWEPQYVMVKMSAGGTQSWFIMDNMRGMVNSTSANTAFLSADGSYAESNSQGVGPTATGFVVNTTGTGMNASGSTYIYMAIRRPNKPPTSGTQVYNAIARTGTGAAATVTGVGFAPDLVDIFTRNVGMKTWVDRLRGVTKSLQSYDTAAEVTQTTAGKDVISFDMDGFTLGPNWTLNVNGSGSTYINYAFKRAPGFFDVVCYTYINSTTPVYHNLGIIPELVIIKQRNSISNWPVWTSQGGGYGKTGFMLNGTEPWVDSDGVAANSSAIYPFYIRHAGGSTTPGSNVAYLFATLAGISKVGSYTGNGTSQNINCGFAAGARFILIKCTSTTGDWFVWDTARGIVTGNDPHLSLNTTAAEVTTDDSIDPYSPGFTVNQLAATNINVTSATYIFLAIS